MSTLLDRDLVASAIIVLAVCAGGWLMLVEPRAAELADLRARLETLEATQDLTTEEAVTRLADRVEAMRADVARIRRRNGFARDSLRLNDEVGDVAKRHGVLLTNFRPTLPDAPPEPGAPAVTRLALALEGGYEDVARCLEELGELEGFVRPTSLHLSPVRRGDEQIVVARFTLEALHFDLPATLVAIERKEAIDARP